MGTLRPSSHGVSRLCLAFGVSSTLLTGCSGPAPIDEIADGGGSAAPAGGAAGTNASGGSAGTAPTGGAAGTGATSGASGTPSGGGASGTPNGGGAGTPTGGSAGTPTGGSGGTPTGGSAGTPTGGSAGTPTGGAAGTPTGGTAGTGGTVTGDRSTAEGTCARWNGDRANMSEGTWSGAVASCTVGDISADGRANALKLINLYRWLADLPPVVTDPARDAQAQACSLMMEAEGSLSHSPGEDWACYSEEGAEGASGSNISGGPGVSSIDAYMVDQGNATTIGHRRWTLSNSLGPIGLGSTGPGGSSCFQNLRGSGRAGKQWMAWPAPGIIPLQAFAPNRGSIDDTGWTIQSDSINLSGAVVTVTSGGTNMPVTVTQLMGGYGSTYAIRFTPMGWDTTAGQTYAVSVSGISTPISYNVQVVSCAQ
jgi:uncharacterized protein YkwD